MELKGGYMGTILRVDLSAKSIKKEPIDPEVAKNFVGAKGFAAYYLFKEIPPKVPALSAENKVMIVAGPLTGTGAPGHARCCVAAKSPLTGGWTDGYFGGAFGPELKYAGYDAIIIEGAAEKPVYLLIEDDKVELKDAKEFWGMGTFDAMRLLKEKHFTDKEPKVLCIGPAGEKQVLIANVIAESRAGGRGGVGAVLGFKKLKAVVVTGHKEVPIADREKFEEARRNAFQKLAKSPLTGPKGALPMMGTANIIKGVNAAGAWPTRNFQTGVFEHVDEICGEAFRDTLWQGGERRKPCPGCPVMCTHLAVPETGPMPGVADEGPEYENITFLGSDVGVADRDIIATAEYLCDFYGLDAISTGATIAFLMECYEKGLISKTETDGLDLKFGNGEAEIEAIIKIGTKSGKLGELGAMGTKRASEVIGKGSEKFAIHVKGLEVPAYDPRAAFGMGVAYARSDRGGCHLRPWTFGAECLGLAPAEEPYVPFCVEGKGTWVKQMNDVVAAFDCSGMCLFMTFGIDAVEDVVPLLNAATGFNFTSADFVKVGERASNVTRAFWFKHIPDFGRKYDTLPWRFLHEPMPEGPAKGKTVPLEPLLNEYYAAAGWDADGKPTKEKLAELGLDFVIKEIY